MFESKGRDGLTALLSQEKPSHSRGECLPDPSLDTSLKSGGADDHAEATQTPCRRKIDQCDPDTPTLAQPKRLRDGKHCFLAVCFEECCTRRI